eukprot:3084827-Alexandrium_andersonii.AAC.1
MDSSTLHPLLPSTSIVNLIVVVAGLGAGPESAILLDLFRREFNKCCGPRARPGNCDSAHSSLAVRSLA